MKYTVVLAARALADLEAARRYIGRTSPATADRWRQAFLQALLRLEQNPEICSVAPESRELIDEVRQFFFRTKGAQANRALFTIDGAEVRVISIRRPGQPLVTKADLEW